VSAPPLADIKAANARVNDRSYALVSMSRPFGPYLAWLAIRLGATPRLVNYLSLGLVFVILALVAFGGAAGRLLGTALVFLWQIVDVTDGTMARALKIRDNFGGFVDYATGIVLAAFLPLALGAGLFRSPEGLLPPLAGAVGLTRSSALVIVLAAGALVSATSLYIRLLNRVLVIRFGEGMAGSHAAPARRESVANVAVKNLETIGGLQAVLFFAGAALGILGPVLVLYAAFYAGLLLAFAAATHRDYSHRTAYLGE
jgi:phosphatidylglycerophosphate synthase